MVIIVPLGYREGKFIRLSASISRRNFPQLAHRIDELKNAVTFSKEFFTWLFPICRKLQVGSKKEERKRDRNKNEKLMSWYI